MLRYLLLWTHFARASLIREMQYLKNFLVAILVEVAYIFATIFIFEIFFFQTNTIADWTRGELYFIYGIFRLSSALGSFFYRANFSELSHLINSGEFDFVLLKPVSSLFFSTLKIVSFTRLSQLVIGLAILGYSINLSELPLTPITIVILAVVIFFGALTRYAFGLLIYVPTFWIGRLDNIYRLEFTLISTARYPRIVFPPVLRTLLTYVVPTLLVAALPSEVVFGKSPWWYLLVVVGVSLGFLLAGSWLFKQGIRVYESASS